MTASCHWSLVNSHWASTMKRVQHDETRNAHICDIWALLIICGSVVVILVVAILQGKCMAGIGKRLVIGDRFSVMGVDGAPLAVVVGQTRDASGTLRNGGVS